MNTYAIPISLCNLHHHISISFLCLSVYIIKRALLRSFTNEPLHIIFIMEGCKSIVLDF